MEEKEIIYELKPKFNIIYELFMPTGIKMTRSIVLIVINIFLIAMVKLLFQNSYTVQYIPQEMKDIIYLVLYILLGFCAIKFVVELVLQIMQYDRIQYAFYEDYLEYKDTFLNQHKKTIQYANIKEIELVRNVWDRICGFGIIVIYTNAEKGMNKGLVMFAMKHSKQVYDKMEEIIHPKEIISEKEETII